MEKKQAQESECWNFNWFHCSSQEYTLGWQSCSGKGWSSESVEIGRTDLSFNLTPTSVHHWNPLSARVQPYLSKSHLKEEKSRGASAWKAHHIHGFHPFLISRPLHFFQWPVAPCTARDPAVAAACPGRGAPALGRGWPGQVWDNVEVSPLRRKCSTPVADWYCEFLHSVGKTCALRVDMGIWWWSCAWKQLPSNKEDAGLNFALNLQRRNWSFIGIYVCWKKETALISFFFLRHHRDWVEKK